MTTVLGTQCHRCMLFCPIHNVCEPSPTVPSKSNEHVQSNTDYTRTEHVDWIDEILGDLMVATIMHHPETTDHQNRMKAKAAILSRLNQALIDELSHVCDGEGHTHWHDDERDYACTIKERIEELRNGK